MTAQANDRAERWVGSCRREILDHIIALNEQHLRRLIRDYGNYYHDERIHDSLEKDAPHGRPVEHKLAANATLISMQLCVANTVSPPGTALESSAVSRR